MGRGNWNFSKIQRPPRQPKSHKCLSQACYHVSIQLVKVLSSNLIRFNELEIEPFTGNSNLFSPEIEVAIWFTQQPYHSVLIFRDVKYVIMAVDYRSKIKDVWYDGTLSPHYYKDPVSRILHLKRATHLKSSSRKWIDKMVASALIGKEEVSP